MKIKIYLEKNKNGEKNNDIERRSKKNEIKSNFNIASNECQDERGTPGRRRFIRPMQNLRLSTMEW